jgi:serine/threonine protein kinase
VSFDSESKLPKEVFQEKLVRLEDLVGKGLITQAQSDALMAEKLGFPDVESFIAEDPFSDESEEISEDINKDDESIRHQSNFSRYENLEFLGQGAMGRVFRAFDPQLQRLVALKLVQVSDPDLLSRFVREARSQARIDHPNVCKVYESGESGTQAFIAMQFVNGKTLKDAGMEMAAEEKVRVVRNVSLAVHAAHRAGLIHRDIKPANIMIEYSDSGEAIPYVTDFGIARELEASKATMSGSIIGSPQYMSPEQALGDDSKVDRRSDVYALGVTLYELFLGSPPFADESSGMVIKRVLDEEPPRPRAKDRTIPGDLETIILKCLEKDQSRRYDSARALADDLTRYLDGDPILARRPSLSYRLHKKVKKNKLVFTLSILSLMAITLIGSLALQERRHQREIALLSQEFGQEVNRMETVMHLAHMQPMHNISTEKNEVRGKIKYLESKVQALGEIANGPGEYAIARGYVALRDFESALAHLRKAMDSGYTGPQVQYAVGLTLGYIYKNNLEQVDRIKDPQLRERRQKEIDNAYRRPALDALQQAKNLQIERPEYVQALISFFQKDYSQALTKASATYKKLPWFYDARRLEGDVFLAIGEEERLRGNYSSAMVNFFEARKKYETARSYAQSDPGIYVSLCQLSDAILRTEAEQGKAGKDILEGAELCDFAINVDDSSAETHQSKAGFYLSVGTYLSDIGDDDPRPALNLSANESRLAWRLSKLPGALNSNGVAIGLIGEFEERHGFNPTRLYEDSVRQFEDTLREDPKFFEAIGNLANAYWRLGMYNYDQGIDPRPYLNKALNYNTQSQKVSSNREILMDAGNIYLQVGIYATEHGQDPVSSLMKSLESYKQAEKENPNWHKVYSDLTQPYFYLGLNDLTHGRSPEGFFSQGVEAGQKALNLNPKDENASIMLGYIYAYWGKYLTDQGRNPEALILKSIQYSEKAAAINHDSGYPYANIALAHSVNAQYRSQLRFDEITDLQSAISFMERAIGIKDNLQWNYMLTGGFYAALAKNAVAKNRDPVRYVQKGLDYLDKSLQINAKSDLALRNRAEIQKIQAEWYAKNKKDPSQLLSAAKRDIDMSNKIHPNDAETCRIAAEVSSLEARLLVNEGKNAGNAVKEGLGWIDLSLKINPRSAESYLVNSVLKTQKSMTGSIVDRSKLNSEAEQLLKKAIAINPNVRQRLPF